MWWAWGLWERGLDLLESIDLKLFVKNICASQRYQEMFFLTFICNQKKNFGTSGVKIWVDSKPWTQFFHDYNSGSIIEQHKIAYAVCQVAGGLLLRNWQEVCKLFIDYLQKIP